MLLQNLVGGIMDNAVLEAIRKRRSIIRFETTPIEEEKIEAILEAGRWAPSWLNKQPWRFILITDQDVKEQVSNLVPTIYNLGVKEAPVCIAVCADPEEDPYHFIEDGAAATQNMALAAQSLGLGSSWIGAFSLEAGKNTAEERIKGILKVPKRWRLISVMAIGVPKYYEEKERKPVSEIVRRDSFQRPM